MKPEKMTPEDIADVQRQVASAGYVVPPYSVIRGLLAHIAALEAEATGAKPPAVCEHKHGAAFGCETCAARVRAKYREFPLQVSRDAKVKPGPLSVPWPIAEKAWAAYAQQYGTGQSVERLAERGGFGWCEMDTFYPGWREEVDPLRAVGRLAVERGAEIDALRERVKALEAENADYSRRLVEQCQRTTRETVRADKAESTIAAFRQRAGEVDELLKPTGVTVARYILGEDGAGHDALVLPGGTVLEVPPGFRAETAEPTATATLGPLWNAYQTAVATEPTTARWFATVRAVLQPLKAKASGPYVRHPDALLALSLLESHMGAMAGAARALIAGAKEGIVVVADVNALESALTDAPPVFTLEEVNQAMVDCGMVGDRDRLAVDAVLSALAALRR